MQKNNIWDICLSVKHTFVMTQYMLNGSLLNFPKGGKFSWTKEAWEVTVWEKERRKQKEEKRQVEPRAKQPGVLSPRFSNALNASTLHDLPPPANRVWAGPPWSLVPMSPLYSLLWPSEQLVMLSLLKTLCTHICDYCIALKLSAYKSVSQTVRDTRWVICEPLCLAQSRCWGNMWYEVGLDALDLEMTAFIPSWASTYRQWELCSHCYLRQTAPLYPESRPIIPVVIIPHPISLVIVSLLLFIFFFFAVLQIKPRGHNACKASTQPSELQPNPNLSMLCRQKYCRLLSLQSSWSWKKKSSLLQVCSTSDFHPHCYLEMVRSVSASVYLAPQQYSIPSISLVLFGNSYFQDSINHLPPQTFHFAEP